MWRWLKLLVNDHHHHPLPARNHVRLQIYDTVHVSRKCTCITSFKPSSSRLQCRLSVKIFRKMFHWLSSVLLKHCWIQLFNNLNDLYSLFNYHVVWDSGLLYALASATLAQPEISGCRSLNSFASFELNTPGSFSFSYMLSSALTNSDSSDI